LKISYSKRTDVLYVTLSSPPTHCSYVELPGGIITRIDDATKQLVGVTVYDFMRKVESGVSMSIPGVGDDLSGIGLLSLHPRAC
jgi:uncharacterized protein YuzE